MAVWGARATLITKTAVNVSRALAILDLEATRAPFTATDMDLFAGGAGAGGAKTFQNIPGRMTGCYLYVGRWRREAT